jgi:hypothetical protein
MLEGRFDPAVFTASDRLPRKTTKAASVRKGTKRESAKNSAQAQPGQEHASGDQNVENIA